MTAVISLTSALKEWAVAVKALTEGEMILLLRKGGIREQSFAVAQSRFWLYPTYEHQKSHLLKPNYASRVTPVAAGWHPQTVPIGAWAEVTHCWEISAESAIQSLSPFHIWTAEFVTERLKWKPKLPLTLLLLRVHRLAEPGAIPYRLEYGGCKSWIDLLGGQDSAWPSWLSPASSQPVLTGAEYESRVAAIQAQLSMAS
jgi:hypothetical protein